MIANVAESIEKREKSVTDINSAAGWIDDNGKVTVNKTLETGDVIGTIKLPFIENGMEGISCECSIVFKRYINESQTTVEETDEVPGYEDLNLEDIINNDGEEEVEERFGKDFIDPDHPVVKRRKVDSGARGAKTGRKMEVYKYKEPDSLNVQNELQNNIVPELLNDPAVVKYLETMTGKTIKPSIKEEVDNEMLEINDESHKDKGLQIYPENRIKNVVDRETNHGDPDVSGGSPNILNKNEDYVIKDVEENQVEKKVSTIVVKLTPKATDAESTQFQDNKSVDISRLHKSEKRHHKAIINDVTELSVESENDDSEQEMMDIESNIKEASTNGENVRDVISEKQLSLFGFKVEQFVEDITKEVKEKFYDTTNDGEEKDILKCNNKLQRKGKGINTPKSKFGNRYLLTDKSLTFCCSVCQKSVHSVDALKKHFLTHKKHNHESSESATVINKRLDLLSKTVSENLTEPVWKSSPGQPSEQLLFYCMVCNKMLPSQQDLKEHCKSHKTGGATSEDIVKIDGTSASEDTLTADSDADYFMNSDTVSLDNVTTDSKISNECVYNSGKKVLLEIVTDNKFRQKRQKMPKKKTIKNDYICENCGTGFFNIHDCMNHMKQCEDSGTLKCFQGCGSRFKSKSLLDVHKKFCSRRIAYLERINNELVKMENPELSGDKDIETLEDKADNLSKCPFCEQVYQTEKKMNHHKLVCPYRPKQRCSHCDFECKGDKSMAKHLVAEHGLKPFQCMHCQRSFRLKNSLSDHMRSIHTKETFTCEYCGKSFIKQSVYRSHVSIQHQGFRLECCYCGKKFKDKKTWKTHETSHKGVYDFACDVCKRTFHRSDQYKTHMLEVHSIYGEAALNLNTTAKKLREELCSNVCSICKEKFPLESAYVVHMMKVHGKEVTGQPYQVVSSQTEHVSEHIQQ
jgi:hypothetical protein